MSEAARALGREERSSPEHSMPLLRRWPLWFVAFAFIHVRRFGGLFLCGLGLQLAVEAAF